MVVSREMGEFQDALFHLIFPDVQQSHVAVATVRLKHSLCSVMCSVATQCSGGSDAVEGCFHLALREVTVLH